jgi:hypothetical protein
MSTAPPLRGAGHADAVSWAQFEQSLVAQEAKRSQHSVGVDVHDGGEVTCRREALPRLGFTIGDCAANLCGDLIVQEGVVGLQPDVPVSYPNPPEARS